MKLNELVKQAHQTAKEKGWWDQERTAPELHMLMVTEIAEATEAARTNLEPIWFYDTLDSSSGYPKPAKKPEGEAVELADAVIRIADYFGHKGWDLEEVIKLKLTYNQTRPHRHGGKRF